MPKVVDPQVRRREISDAACRVIERGGLSEATLGNVADEAGLAIGSVRHFVGSHTDLLRLTMINLAADVGDRIADRGAELLAARARWTPQQRRTALVELLGELLPLDDLRRREAVVWIAFGEAARTDPDLQPLFVDLFDRVRVILLQVLTSLRPNAGRAANELDAHRLAGLMNGLSLDAIQVPQRVDPAMIRKLIRRELASILD